MKISVCYYVATSVDGLIADWGGKVDWLSPYFGKDFGFRNFPDLSDTVVMGRRTYDGFLQRSRENPYEGKRFVVLSRSRTSGPHADLFWEGHLVSLMLRLGKMGTRSVRIVGGGLVAGAFLEAGLIDEVQQFVVPVALGSGTPVFGPLRDVASLQLTDTQSFPNGVLRLRYVLAGSPGVDQTATAKLGSELVTSPTGPASPRLIDRREPAPSNNPSPRPWAEGDPLRQAG